MNRRSRIVLISSVSVGLLLSLTTLVILTSGNGGSRLTVSFVNAEASNGRFPSYAPSERLDFAVRNAGPKRAWVDVFEIEDEHGNSIPSPQYTLGDVEAGQSTHFYLYLPLGSHPRSLRMRVREKASAVQKAQFAIRLLTQKASGRYPYKQVWIDGLKVPAYEFIIKLDKKAEPDGAANGSQPVRSQTNRTSAAAGSGR